MASADELLIVDYSASGKALGVEITAPQAVPLDRLNQLPRGAWRAAPRGAYYTPARAAWPDTICEIIEPCAP